MSKRAEELSLKAYPISPSCLSESNGDGDRNHPRRLAFIEGYKQAEKELELTWEDIANIDVYMSDVECEFRKAGRRLGDDTFYKEVFKRFKEEKK